MVDAAMLTKIAATGLSGIFAGASIFISIVQHPALIETSESDAFRAPFFRRMYCYAARMQSFLAISSGSCAFASWWSTRNSSNGTFIANEKQLLNVHETTLWLIGGSLMLAIIPYTILRMLVINEQLTDTEVCLARGRTWMQRMLRRWGSLHAIRSYASGTAYCLMIIALAQGCTKC